MQLQRFSTDGQPRRLRLDYWNEVTGTALTTQVADPADRAGFYGHMISLDVGDVRFAQLTAAEAVVSHTRAHASSSAAPVYLLRLAMNRHFNTTQDGREIRLNRGDFTLYDTSRPYRMHFGEDCSVLILRIPRAKLLRYVARPETMVNLVMRGNAGLSGLVSRHIREIWCTSQEFLAHGAADRIVEMTMQLLASAYYSIPQARSDDSCLSVGHRARIVEYIERHLSEPDLAPCRIAAALRITPAYLHRLFAGESETVARYILRRRLEECSSALKNPLQRARSITSIAFASGFNSLPHFSRVFREHFGATPSEFRNS